MAMVTVMDTDSVMVMAMEKTMAIAKIQNILMKTNSKKSINEK